MNRFSAASQISVGMEPTLRKMKAGYGRQSVHLVVDGTADYFPLLEYPDVFIYNHRNMIDFQVR